MSRKKFNDRPFDIHNGYKRPNTANRFYGCLLHRTGEALQDIKFCNFMADINYDIPDESLVTIKTLNNRKKIN
ncbi:hypothetical protein M2347_003799 [Chryseobacterium sp. H1D6B]|nr:hypothetical protein [Chryseobacterium sp. H1D6B]